MNRRLAPRFTTVPLAIGLMLGLIGSVTAEVRFVPQLVLTSLAPIEVAYLPGDDEKIMVVNSDGRIDILDVSHSKGPIKLTEIHAGARDAMIGPVSASWRDMRIVSGGADGTVRLWMLDGEPAAKPFRGHDGPVNSVAFSPDGTRIVSGSADGTVRLWTLEGEPAAKPFRGHDGPVNSVAFSPDGIRIVSGGENGMVRLWTLDGESVAADPFWGHDGPVSSVAFSPDGTRIVSGGDDSTVRLWTLDGEPAAGPFTGHEHRVMDFYSDSPRDSPLTSSPPVVVGGVSSVAFSPDGTRIVSGGEDGTVRLWTLDGEPAAEPFRGHTAAFVGVSSVAFSPDGTRIVSGGGDGTVRLWKVVGERAAEPFTGHEDRVSSVAFSPDGTRIVSGGADGTVRLWTLDGERAAEPFSGHHNSVLSVAFSPDGTRIVSGGEDGTVRLWTLDGERAAEPFSGHHNSVLSVAFSPDGTRIVSGGEDGTVRLWTLDGEPAAEPFRGHTAAFVGVSSVAFSPDGTRIVSGGGDGTVRLWTLDGERAAEPFTGHEDRVSSVAFSPDGTRIVSGGTDGTVRLWTLDGEPAAKPFSGHKQWVFSVAFSPDGTRIVSGGTDGTVRLWTLDGERAAEPFRGHNQWVYSVAFSPDGTRIVSSGRDGRVRLWKVVGGRAAEPFSGHTRGFARALSVAFSPDGTRIVSGGTDGTVRLWTRNGEPAAGPFRGHDGAVTSVAFSPDGTRIVSGGHDATVRLWTLDGEPAAEPFTGHEGWMVLWTPGTQIPAVPLRRQSIEYLGIFSVAFSSDGTRIVSGGADGTVRLWTLDGKPAAKPFSGHNQWVFSVAFSPDGTRIVSGGTDGTVRLWTLDGEPAAEPFRGHDGAVTSVAFSPDGTRIVSGGREGTVRLWTLDGERVAKLFRGHDGAVTSVAFSPDGKRIYFQGRDNRLRSWDRKSTKSRAVGKCKDQRGFGFLPEHLLWYSCADRLRIVDEESQERGEIFLHDLSLVAHVPGKGIYVSTTEIERPFVAVDGDGNILWHNEAIPSLDAARLRQLLLDDWTLSEWVLEHLHTAWATAVTWHDSLSWKGRLIFWPMALWVTVVLFVLAVWWLAPHKLAHWTMPADDKAQLPRWPWLVHVVSLFDWLGTTRRPLQAWLHKHRAELIRNNFLDRTPVTERARYCDLGQNDVVQEFAKAVVSKSGARFWIHGEGGGGKSALAYHMLRVATPAEDKTTPLPILIYWDWSGSLREQIARDLKVDNRVPTPRMVQILGARGWLCPLIDGLSERGLAHGQDDVATLLTDHGFKSIIVTSRKRPPHAKVWESFTILSPGNLDSSSVYDYVAAYAPEDRHAVVAQRIKPLVSSDRPMNPLFMRLAIEQALESVLTSYSTLDLVQSYVAKLWTDGVCLNKYDLLRAASVAAIESVRHELAPREIKVDLLHGVLTYEADSVSFLDPKMKKGPSVSSARIVDVLIDCGLLQRKKPDNEKLQFTYDPVAEHLAAHWISQHDDREGFQKLLRILAENPEYPIARILSDIKREKAGENVDIDRGVALAEDRAAGRSG